MNTRAAIIEEARKNVGPEWHDIAGYLAGIVEALALENRKLKPGYCPGFMRDKPMVRQLPEKRRNQAEIEEVKRDFPGIETRV